MDHAARAERIFRILRNKNNAYLPTLSKVFYDGKRNQQRVIHAVDCFFYFDEKFPMTFFRNWQAQHTLERCVSESATGYHLSHRACWNMKKNMNILKNILPFMFFCDPIFSYSLMKRGKNSLK